MDDLERRVHQLGPSFRFRIEQWQAYHPSQTKELEREVRLSEVAERLVRKIQGEEALYYWTTRARRHRIALADEKGVHGLEKMTNDQHDHVGKLALQYVQNPDQLQKVPFYGK